MGGRRTISFAGVLWVCVGLAQAVSPPFSIEEQDGVAWLRKPGGERFFSFGVCVVNTGATRQNFDTRNPAYASWKYYESSNRWAEATLQRLKSWGFTTIGGWSDFRAFAEYRETNVVFTPVLHVASMAGAPWWDMWDTNIIARMHQIARDQILPLREDRRVLGYYSDNEMGWWNATLFKMTLEQASTSGQRQRLIHLLRENYQNEWKELLKDFDPEQAKSFEELEQRGLLFLRPGGHGIQIYRRFLELAAERYYSLVREIIRAYDPRGLILGDRYQSFYYPEVARACGRHVDAASGNLNASWNDGTFVRYYLDTLHALSGKPVFVSEFYMAAGQNRSGNKNDQGMFPTVSTQRERASGFGNTIQALLRLPYVIGADWFQYYDEPARGRFDGENYNFGLVDVHNRPYELLTGAASAMDLASLKTGRHPVRMDALQGVPPAPANPLSQFTPMLALKQWDRERGFVKPVSAFPVADLYVCWDKRALYLGLYAQDVVEEAYYRDKVVPEEDRSQWIISIGNSDKPIRARIGAGARPSTSEPDARIVGLSGLDGNTRNIAAMEIPAKLLGKDKFKPGETIEIASSFFTHCRAYQVEWKGKFILRAE